jgi:hypothetical protein
MSKAICKTRNMGKTAIYVLDLPKAWFTRKPPRKLRLRKLTPEQIQFMCGGLLVGGFKTWWPLLRAGYIRPNPDAPPMFLTTEAGEKAMTRKPKANRKGL